MGLPGSPAAVVLAYPYHQCVGREPVLDKVLASPVRRAYLYPCRPDDTFVGRRPIRPGAGIPSFCIRLFAACAFYAAAQFPGSLFLDPDGLWAFLLHPDGADQRLIPR